MSVHVLAVVACPADTPAYESEKAWETFRSGCAPLGGQVSLERLPEATEVALKRRLAERPVQALVFIGHGRARHGVGYATLALEGAGRKARWVNAQYFAALLNGRTPLVILFAVADNAPFGGVPETLISHGVGAAIAARRKLDDWSVRTLMRELLATLIAGQTFGGAFASLGADFEYAFDSRRVEQAVTLSSPPIPTPRQTPEEDALVRARRDFERKRALGQFDVFLCHNKEDKPAVKRIAEQLKLRGYLPWLDEWELPPGVPWQPQLEAQIAAIPAAAVFVGKAGMGPWQQAELQAFLAEFIRRWCPVIPTILPDAPADVLLPLFLRQHTAVDFRIADPDPLQRLIWGITARRGAGD